jgi:hypothetical protein
LQLTWLTPRLCVQTTSAPPLSPDAERQEPNMDDVISLNKYSKLLILQEKINLALKEIYVANKELGRDHLSTLLVNEIAKLVERLNAEE